MNTSINKSIADVLRQAEKILWQGRPNRETYIKSVTRVNAVGVLSAAVIGFLFSWLLLGLSVLYAIPIYIAFSLIIILVGAPIKRRQFQKITFLGERAVTDRRILVINMDGGLRQMPIDKNLTFKIRKRMPWIEFAHPRAGQFAFGFLDENELEQLRELLPTRNRDSECSRDSLNQTGGIF